MTTPSTPRTPPAAGAPDSGPAEDNAPDRLIGGRYRLIRLLGSGGMGDVWEAWDERLHRAVAVKRLYAQPGVSDDIAEVATNRAMREARITARLQHPHAVTVYDVVEDRGQPCLVMQLVPSEPLSARLSGGRTLPLQEVALLGSHLAGALSAAHQAGIVHRDVKPGNVLLAEDGTARLSDFGIAHAMGDVTLTSTGMVTGTPAYLAPEVARGEESAYPADVFSLGATLYTALEGHPPFGTDGNPMALLHRVASGVVDPPQHSGALTPLLEEMLQADPDDRPSMAEVTGELAAIAAGSAPTTSMPTVQQDGPLPLPLTDEPDAFEELGRFGDVDEVAPAAAGEPGPHDADRRVPVRPAPATTRRRRGPWLLLAALVLLALLAFALWRTQAGDTPVATPPAVSSSAPASSAPASSAPSTAPTSPSPAPSSAPSSATSAAPTTSAPAPATTTSAPPPSTTSPAPATPSAGELAAAVNRYYGLMPGGTDQGWSLLTARYQSEKTGGRQAYQRFWDQFSKVTATDVTGSSPGTVKATITYTYKDGRTSREATTFGMVVDGGVLKIDTSSVG